MNKVRASRSRIPTPIEPTKPPCYMGVIRAMNEAERHGYSPGDLNWVNMGQGQPEVGPITGALPRIRLQDVTLEAGDDGYGPVEGIRELRQSVADHYNRLYRRGKGSQYTSDNVSITSGGRCALARALGSLGRVRVGFVSPDYASYKGLLSMFDGVQPIQLIGVTDLPFRIDPPKLLSTAVRQSVGAVLLSNPCNPTGACIRDRGLDLLVRTASNRGFVLLLDEYYSHYIYPRRNEDQVGPVSAAAFVEDVNRDPVVIVDGLTKSFRYPGWRIGWTVGPQELIRNITAIGSSLDGGAPRPLQRAAVKVLEPARADQETRAMRVHFKRKRDLCVEALERMGIEFPCPPEATIYAFGSTRGLSERLNTGQRFFKEALEYRVITVPGEYFDIAQGITNGNGKRSLRDYVRFSFGPTEAHLVEGLNNLTKMVRDLT